MSELRWKAGSRSSRHSAVSTRPKQRKLRWKEFMNEPPAESRFKYGRDQFDDVDYGDLVGFLSGGGAERLSDIGAQPGVPGKTEVDEDVLREAGDPDRHYGR